MVASEGLRQLLHRLGEKYTVRVRGFLAERPHRYNELKRRCGVTSKGLTRMLRALETEGIISRLESPAIRPQVDYELTPIGRSLARFVGDLNRWLERQQPAASRPRPSRRRRITRDADASLSLEQTA